MESGEKLITFKVMRFCSVARHYKISGTRRVGIQKVSMDEPNIFNLSLKKILAIWEKHNIEPHFIHLNLHTIQQNHALVLA